MYAENAKRVKTWTRTKDLGMADPLLYLLSYLDSSLDIELFDLYTHSICSDTLHCLHDKHGYFL